MHAVLIDLIQWGLLAAIFTSLMCWKAPALKRWGWSRTWAVIWGMGCLIGGGAWLATALLLGGMVLAYRHRTAVAGVLRRIWGWLAQLRRRLSSSQPATSPVSSAGQPTIRLETRRR